MNEPVGVLGRLSYSDINKNGLVESNKMLSEADYYPFGLQHTGNSIATTANKAAEKYQYNDFGEESEELLTNEPHVVLSWMS